MLFHRELIASTCDIVVDSDADPALVVGDVVDSIGRRSPERAVHKVRDANRFWRADAHVGLS
jgi:hypothetical protein